MVVLGGAESSLRRKNHGISMWGGPREELVQVGPDEPKCLQGPSSAGPVHPCRLRDPGSSALSVPVSARTPQLPAAPSPLQGSPPTVPNRPRGAAAHRVQPGNGRALIRVVGKVRVTGSQARDFPGGKNGRSGSVTAAAQRSPLRAPGRSRDICSQVGG